MVKVGCFLSSEEWGPNEQIEYAEMAEAAGFSAFWISDHFHPWLAEQGNSPFVWSAIGGLSQATSLPITTGVTCPTMRIHPAIIAHAAATCAVMTNGKFALGVGSGENLNEHIFGAPWPSADVGLEMLEESIEAMRLLWEGGVKDHEGKHYVVENAHLYTLPDEPPPALVSGFGPKAVELAGRVGDGYCGVAPEAELVSLFRSSGGGGKPAHAGTKVCFGEAEAMKTAHRLWANDGLPGELAQELPTPNATSRTSANTPRPATTRCTSSKSAPTKNPFSISTSGKCCRSPANPDHPRLLRGLANDPG